MSDFGSRKMSLNSFQFNGFDGFDGLLSFLVLGSGGDRRVDDRLGKVSGFLQWTKLSYIRARFSETQPLLGNCRKTKEKERGLVMLSHAAVVVIILPLFGWLR